MFVQTGCRRVLESLIETAPNPAGDRNHGDYHAWNEGEDSAYRQFLAARRRGYRAFFKLRIEEQREYWAWRHSHSEPDHDNR